MAEIAAVVVAALLHWRMLGSLGSLQGMWNIKLRLQVQLFLLLMWQRRLLRMAVLFVLVWARWNFHTLSPSMIFSLSGRLGSVHGSAQMISPSVYAQK